MTKQSGVVERITHEKRRPRIQRGSRKPRRFCQSSCVVVFVVVEGKIKRNDLIYNSARTHGRTSHGMCDDTIPGHGSYLERLHNDSLDFDDHVASTAACALNAAAVSALPKKHKKTGSLSSSTTSSSSSLLLSLQSSQSTTVKSPFHIDPGDCASHSSSVTSLSLEFSNTSSSIAADSKGSSRTSRSKAVASRNHISTNNNKSGSTPESITSPKSAPRLHTTDTTRNEDTTTEDPQRLQQTESPAKIALTISSETSSSCLLQHLSPNGCTKYERRLKQNSSLVVTRHSTASSPASSLSVSTTGESTTAGSTSVTLEKQQQHPQAGPQQQQQEQQRHVRFSLEHDTDEAALDDVILSQASNSSSLDGAAFASSLSSQESVESSVGGDDNSTTTNSSRPSRKRHRVIPIISRPSSSSSASRRRTTPSKPGSRRQQQQQQSNGMRVWEIEESISAAAAMNEEESGRVLVSSRILDTIPEHGVPMGLNKRKATFSSDTNGFKMSTKSHRKRESKADLSPTKRAATTTSTAAMNASTIQDACQHQMLVDECIYLSGTLMQCHSINAGLDLVSLLSVSHNRSVLFSIAESDQNCLIRDDNKNDDSNLPLPLQSVLDVIAWAQSLVAGSIPMTKNGTFLSLSPHTKNDGTMDTNAIGRSKKMRSNQRQQRQVSKSSVSIGQDESYAPTYSTQRQLLDVVGMCLYFVSLDCTLSDQSSGGSKSSQAARRIRRAVLSHAPCLQGILYMVLADPLTQHLRGNVPTTIAHKGNRGDHDTACSSPRMGTSSPGPVTNQKIDRRDFGSVASPNPSISSSAVGTPDSLSSTGSVDPTVAGRRNRRRQRLEKKLIREDVSEKISIDSGADSDCMSFASSQPSDSIAVLSSSFAVAESPIKSYENKAKDQHDRATLRIVDSINVLGYSGAFLKAGASWQHSCGNDDQYGLILSSYLPLAAITRIVSGKCEGHDKACIDDENGRDESVFGNDFDPVDDDYNPLLETNRLLEANGSIPLLSQALAESLAAVSTQLTNTSDATGSETGNYQPCKPCLSAIEERVYLLVSLIDGASLLSETNREMFSVGGYTQEAGGNLIVALIRLLRKLSITCGSVGRCHLFDSDWGEMTLAMLRMLTSLSHENTATTKEFEANLVDRMSEQDKCGSDFICGISVIAGVLRQAVWNNRQAKNDDIDGKLVYDAAVFCLNILANFAESGGSCRLLSSLPNPAGHDADSSEDDTTSVMFLTWLTRWLVSETQSFRDAVTEMDFGTLASKHLERKLDHQESEKLVTAGNGFVFLSCVLVDEIDDDDASAVSAYSIILTELPGDDREAKVSFLKNTLKAFCNFYHFTIGELSIAVVGPVKSLIQRLDSMNDKRRRRSLGLE